MAPIPEAPGRPDEDATDANADPRERVDESEEVDPKSGLSDDPRVDPHPPGSDGTGPA